MRGVRGNELKGTLQVFHITLNNIAEEKPVSC